MLKFKSLVGKIVLVIGVVGGIGLVIVEWFLCEGVCVVFVDIDMDVFVVIEDNFFGCYLKDVVWLVIMDVISEDVVVDSFVCVVFEFGGVDILVFNVGIVFLVLIEKIMLDLWNCNMLILLMGYFLVLCDVF